MRALAAILMTVMLAACAPGSTEKPRETTAARIDAVPVGQGSTPVTTKESTGTCERPRTFLETADQTVFVPSSWDQRRPVTVRVGDVIHLLATGTCARQVSASPQNSRLRVVGYSDAGPRYFKAVRPGIVRLVISKPMCPALPRNSTAQTTCIGGVQPMGTAIVTVRPTRD